MYWCIEAAATSPARRLATHYNPLYLVVFIVIQRDPWMRRHDTTRRGPGTRGDLMVLGSATPSFGSRALWRYRGEGEIGFLLVALPLQTVGKIDSASGKRHQPFIIYVASPASSTPVPISHSQLSPIAKTPSYLFFSFQ